MKEADPRLNPAAACGQSWILKRYPRYLPFDPEGAPPEMRGKLIATAKAICATCEVKAACLAHAQKYQEDTGVWGGMSTAERVSLRTGRSTRRREVRRVDPTQPPARPVVEEPTTKLEEEWQLGYEVMVFEERKRGEKKRTEKLLRVTELPGALGNPSGTTVTVSSEGMQGGQKRGEKKNQKAKMADEIAEESFVAYSFAEKFAYILARQGETQSSLARKIFADGNQRSIPTIRTSITMIINGNPPNPRDWESITQALQLPEDDFFIRLLNDEADLAWKKELERRERAKSQRQIALSMKPEDPTLILARERATALRGELIVQEEEKESQPKGALGQELGSLRKKKGMSVGDLARATGLTDRTIRITESGQSVPTREGVLDRMLRALDVGITSTQGKRLIAQAKKERPAIVSTYESDKEKAWIMQYLERYASVQTAGLVPLFDGALTERQIRRRLGNLAEEGKVYCDQSYTWHIRRTKASSSNSLTSPQEG